MNRLAGAGDVRRVPFSIPQIAGGLFRAVGTVWYTDRRLVAQYEIVTELFRWRMLGPVRIAIPASSLDGISLRTGPFRSVLVLHALDQAVVGGLPGSRGGEAWLRFAGRDARAARELAATLELAVAEREQVVLERTNGLVELGLTSPEETSTMEWP